MLVHAVVGQLANPSSWKIIIFPVYVCGRVTAGLAESNGNLLLGG